MIFNADSREMSSIDLPEIDFSISSPYWDILNRSTNKFAKERNDKDLDVNYSNDINDLGNIEDYEEFIQKLSNVYLDVHKKLKLEDI